MIIKSTKSGRVVTEGSLSEKLPDLPYDAKVHGWKTGTGLWISTQGPGQPREVYPGGDGEYLGHVMLPASEEAAFADAVSREAESALSRLNDGYQSNLSELLETYPQAETMTFDKQEREARELQAWKDAGEVGDMPATPLISAIAQGRQMKKDDVADRVIAKADAWIQASGIATGRRQYLEDRIAEAVAAQDIEKLQSIDW